MENIIIVGSGITGLLAARVLNQHGLAFLGLEKEDKLAANCETSQNRLLNESSVNFLKKFVPSVEWSRIDEAPVERRKGEWIPLKQDSLVGQEKVYFKDSYFYPLVSFTEFASKIAEPIASHFTLGKTVAEINLSEKTLICKDGSEFIFSRVLWCADIASLLKICKHGKSTLKTSKKLEHAKGLINLFWASNTHITENKNSIAFSFRYKEYKLKAIGVTDPRDKDNTQNMQWVLPVEKELAEDREEIAKCVRALKRELLKEFPESAATVSKEKIVFNPSVLDDLQIPAKNLEVFDGVTYIGPNLLIEEESTEERVGLDLAVNNCIKFEESLNAH